MRMRWVFPCILILFFARVSAAETIYLKDGRVINGKIEQKTDYYVIVLEGNFPRKYYDDQIDHIEADPEVMAVETGTEEVDVYQFDNISTKKAKLILSLIEANGTRRSLEINIDQIVAKTPLESKAQLEELFKANEILETLIPIYDKYYDEKELEELIRFYQSPIGQKFLEVTPKIVDESMQANIQYFKQRINP
ncbi:MAG TPA: hypothetical protein DD723_02655 [Candidatus Omnitrophica bacterium]|nr:MAG: hypothetical protein A2Z81_01625 [Omnitrophica WOR_2 bacterium GWA2_45_18]HBR14427.1 hypothetical protein [Candidatus Omnitrophota bacterium]